MVEIEPFQVKQQQNSDRLFSDSTPIVLLVIEGGLGTIKTGLIEQQALTRGILLLVCSSS